MADFLTIGTSGLQAYRRSLEVTGNNIVNANTEGYARRDVQLQGVGDAASSPTNIRTGSGSGVAVDVVRRATDVFVQAEKRLTQSASSAATALADRLDRLEKSMFSGDGDLGKLSQTLFSRLQDFATTPSSIAARTTVIQAANDLADGFNVQAQRLVNEANAIVTDAQSQFDDLNALTKQLAELNKQIESMGGEKGKANDLLDQRDKLVDGIVKIVSVTVESRPSGAVNLYLSDGTGGPQLVGPNGAKPLQASRVNGHLQITLDPYNTNVPIAKISGGVVGGVQSFDDQITSMANQLDRMAVGFVKRINDQHAKGTDLDGQRGLPLFSTDTFTISAAKSNRGLVSASLDMGQVASVEPGDYRASFNQADGKWTIINQISGKKASGSDTIAIDGMTLRFTGQPADGDVFTFSPLVNAASGMRVLINDPRQLAASLPQLAEAVAGNTSSANIDLVDTGARVDSPNIPSLSALFSQSLSPENAVSFKNDAIISAIPSGSMADPKSPITFYSFGELSSATFKVDLKSSAWDTKSAPSLNVVHGLDNSKFYIDSDLGILNLELFSNGLPPSLADSPNSAQILADEINRVFETQTKNGVKVSDAFFASANGNFVTINGLGDHEIKSALLKRNDANATTISTATITAKASAADLNIISREGIQLSGKTLIKSSLIKDFNAKSINGFLDTATIPQSLPVGVTAGSTSTYTYRNLTIVDSQRPLSEVHSNNNQGRSSQVSFDVTPETDSPALSSDSRSAAPGAVYSLKIDGLPSTLRLAGGAIAGKASTDLAQMMLDKVNALGPQRRIIGGALDFSSSSLADLGKATFNLTIDGQTALVTFNRSSNVKTGAYLPTGTFSVAWAPSVTNPPALNLTMQNVPVVTSSNSNTGTASLSASLNPLFSGQNQVGDYQFQYSSANQEWTATRPDGTQTSFASLPATIDGLNIASSGNPSDGDTFTISAAGTGARLVIDLPKNLSTTSSTISISGSDAEKLGFSNNTVTEQIISGSKLSDTGLFSSAQSFIASKYGIDSSKIKLADDGSIILSRSLANPSQITTLSLKTTTSSDRLSMTSFGFLGTDLTASRQGNTISLASTIADSTALTDASQSVSRIGHKVTISSSDNESTIPEDLLVALQHNSSTGARSVAARFDSLSERANPEFPDIEVKVKSAGLLEIYALKTDSNGALLRDDSGVPIKEACLQHVHINREYRSIIWAQSSSLKAMPKSMMCSESQPTQTGQAIIVTPWL